MADLSQARVLMLAADGFETVELFEPRKALEAEGVTVTLASIKRDPIQGMKQDINQAERSAGSCGSKATRRTASTSSAKK